MSTSFSTSLEPKIFCVTENNPLYYKRTHHVHKVVINRPIDFVSRSTISRDIVERGTNYIGQFTNLDKQNPLNRQNPVNRQNPLNKISPSYCTGWLNTLCHTSNQHFF